MSGPASAPDPSVMWGDAGTRIVLVRHGEPEDGPDCGPDPGLTDLGRRQAAAMAAVVGNEAIDAVYVSGQRRAQETGDALAAALGLTATSKSASASSTTAWPATSAPGQPST